mmetsp:Transcript_8124/g.20305  ORF Transcript_8124/g.20305 Transcript_8124/m.20305 type:complete len:280 (-) Transcript_8124:629-1468(-)
MLAALRMILSSSLERGPSEASGSCAPPSLLPLPACLGGLVLLPASPVAPCGWLPDTSSCSSLMRALAAHSSSCTSCSACWLLSSMSLWCFSCWSDAFLSYSYCCLSIMSSPSRSCARSAALTHASYCLAASFLYTASSLFRLCTCCAQSAIWCTPCITVRRASTSVVCAPILLSSRASSLLLFIAIAAVDLMPRACILAARFICCLKRRATRLAVPSACLPLRPPSAGWAAAASAVRSDMEPGSDPSCSRVCWMPRRSAMPLSAPVLPSESLSRDKSSS